MQEKIEQALMKHCRVRLWPRTEVIGTEEAAAEIARLFERKVTWEGEAYVDGFGRIRFLDPQSGELPIPTVDDEELAGEMFYPGLAAGKGTVLPLAGQPVRVIVEEIDDKKPTD